MDKIWRVVLSESTSQEASKTVSQVLLVEDQLQVVPFPVLLVKLTLFSLATLASRPRNGILSNSLAHAVKSLKLE
jgi:hypothetical protein